MSYNIKRLDLQALPCCLASKGALPDFPVVYIIFDDNDVYYVGATVSLFNRWSAHRSDWKIGKVIKRKGVKVAWVEAKVEQLGVFETALIRFLRPRLNTVQVGYHHAEIKRPRRSPFERLKKSNGNGNGR